MTTLFTGQGAELFSLEGEKEKGLAEITNEAQNAIIEMKSGCDDFSAQKVEALAHGAACPIVDLESCLAKQSPAKKTKVKDEAGGDIIKTDRPQEPIVKAEFKTEDVEVDKKRRRRRERSIMIGWTSTVRTTSSRVM